MTPERWLSARVALVALVILAFAPLIAVFHLELSNSAEDYIPADSAAAVFERELRERFPVDEVLVAAFAGDAIYSDAFLEALDRVVADLRAHPLVDRVLAPSTLDHITATSEGFMVEPLLDAAVRTGLSPEGRLQRLQEDRFARGLLVSADGSLLAIAVRPHVLSDSLQRLAVQRAFEDAVREAGIERNLVALSGQIALNVAQLRATLKDSLMFVPATLAIGLTLIGWLFRRWLAVVAAVTVMLGVLGVTLAFLVLANHPFTLVTAILPPLMVSLSIALLIHWYNALALVTRHGVTGEERVSRAVAAIHRPALFTALTTAAGLISLSMSPIPPIRALGQAAALGVLVLYVLVIWVLPPIFARWDHGSWSVQGGGINGLDRPVAALRRVGMRHPAMLLIVTVLVLGAAIPRIADVEVETDLFRFFAEDHPITQANRLFKERISGISTLEVVFLAPHRDAFQEVERLRDVERFRDWISTHPAVDRVVSMVDMLEEMHWGFHEADPDFRRLPTRDALVAQYLFIYDGNDLYELVDRDFRTTRVLLNLNIDGAREVNALIRTIETYLEREVRTDTETRTAGFGRLFGDQERLLIQGQVRGLATAVILIYILLLLLWRSLAGATLCMVPNLSPIVLIFATMGLLGLWLDMATAMIAGIAVGIAVDDTIHVYHGYQSRLSAGRSHVWALARTYQHSGRAVAATTLILAAQFLILASSEFVPTREFGLLTALGLVTALVFDLLVLPAMLTVIAGYRARKGSPRSR